MKRLLMIVFLLSIALRANARVVVELTTGKISADRIGVIVTDPSDRVIPASSMPYLYKALVDAGFTPVYLNDIGIASRLTKKVISESWTDNEGAVAEALRIDDDVVIYAQELAEVQEQFEIDYVLFLSQYKKKAVHYNVNASLISLKDRSVVAYRYDRRGPAITALLTAGCFAWFGAPIFWVAFPVSSHLTTKRIGNDICDFVRSCKR